MRSAWYFFRVWNLKEKVQNIGCKKQGAKKQGHCYSKTEEARLHLLFWNTNDLFFAPCLSAEKVISEFIPKWQWNSLRNLIIDWWRKKGGKISNWTTKFCPLNEKISNVWRLFDTHIQKKSLQKYICRPTSKTCKKRQKAFRMQMKKKASWLYHIYSD